MAQKMYLHGNKDSRYYADFLQAAIYRDMAEAYISGLEIR